jgi:hypothetical protein
MSTWMPELSAVQVPELSAKLTAKLTANEVTLTVTGQVTGSDPDRLPLVARN